MCNSNLKEYKDDATLEENVIAHIAQETWIYFSFEYQLYFRFLLKVLRRNKIDTTETVVFTYSKSIKLLN